MIYSNCRKNLIKSCKHSSNSKLKLKEIMKKKYKLWIKINSKINSALMLKLKKFNRNCN